MFVYSEIRWEVFFVVAAIAASSLIVQEAAADTADTSETSDGDDVIVRTVERETMQRDDARFASGHMTRVDVDELSFRGETLSDALSRVTGTYVRRDSSMGQPAYLSVRGGNPRQTVVELDGLRLSSSAGAGFDAGQMMTDGIGSADVIRGSGAAVYGGGAVTGAMRLNPASPPDDGWQLRGRSSVGSFDTVTMGADMGVGNETGGIRLHGGVRQSQGDFDFVDDQGTDHRRINNDHQRVGLGATGRLEKGADEFRLTGRWESGTAGSPGPSEFQRAFQSARVDDERQLATLRWKRHEALQRSSMVVDTHATVGAQQRTQGYRNEEGFMTREPFESQSVGRTVAMTGGAAALIGDSHLARADVEGRWEGYEGQIQSSDRPALNASRRTVAGSVADEWLVFDERLSLIAALRSEFSHGGQAGSAGVESQPLLPALGAIVRAHRRLEFRANMARTFRMADFDELYLETEGIRGNPDLDPEQAWTADVGLQVGANDDRVQVRGAVFAHSIDAMILFLPVSAHLFEAQNLYGATSRGVEAAMRATLVDRWTLSGGYTATRATLDSSAGGSPSQLPGQPRHRLAVESEFELTGLSVGFELPELYLLSAAHYRSRVNLDNFGNLSNPGVMRLDMGLSARLSDWFRAALQVQDMADQKGAHDSLHRPLPGRALWVSVEVLSEGGGGR